MPLSAVAGEPVYFCPSCGWGLRSPAEPTGTVAVPPALVLVADLPHHAGLVRRVTAASVDLFLGGLAGLVAAAIATQVALIVQGSRTANTGIVAWIVGLAALLAYQPLFWARNGRTPGMQLLGIRLSRPDGSPIRPLQAVVRELAMVVSAVPLGLGFAAAVRDPRGQAWHDAIARTVVVTTTLRP